MSSTRKKVIVIAVLLITTATSAYGQGSHYWSLQYGTRSTLLGGAIIGDADDLSATYYNPGAMTLLDSGQVILAARAFQYTKYTFTNGLQEDVELDDKDLNPVPTLVAGSLPFLLPGKTRLSYSLLVRYKYKMGLEGRRIDSRDVVSQSPGSENFVGEAQIEEKLSETWAGLTASHRIGSGIGIGLTSYLAIRNQKGRSSRNAQALQIDGNVASVFRAREYDFENARMLWKIGLAWQYRKLGFGFSLTTPSVNLWGSGSLGLTNTSSGVDRDGDGVSEDQLLGGFEDDINAEYHSPLSIGVGVSYSIGRTSVHFSSEWFDAVDLFTVMDAGYFTWQSSGDSTRAIIQHQLDDVINYGIGVEHILSEVVSVFASYATDFTASLPESTSGLSASVWDIYHITGGSSLTIRGARLTIGLGYASGKEKATIPLDFTGADEDNGFIGTGNSGYFKYRKYKFILGVSF